MTISKTSENNNTVLAITGKLDSNTSKELSKEIEPVLAEACDITLDFTALQTISSAGLRVLLSTHKSCKAGGKTMIIKGANPSVQEVFDLMGFTGLFTII